MPLIALKWRLIALEALLPSLTHRTDGVIGDPHHFLTSLLDPAIQNTVHEGTDYNTNHGSDYHVLYQIEGANFFANPREDML
jgi:hypothetical protein